MMLTVFTPTFNRGYRLHLCYESLLRQTSKDFKWLIVDDGSTDNTRNLVHDWIDQNKLDIQYIYQENQGVAMAHQTALYAINTELNICIDSDDYMPDDAVEVITRFWKEKGSNQYAGVIGLDRYENGKIIGNRFPKNIRSSGFAELYERHKIVGDKKIANRTDLAQKYLPFPKISGERFPAVSYLYLLINQECKYLLVNEVFCIVEYLPDGISMNKIDHYKKSPLGFIEYRKARMRYASRYIDRFKHAMHYVSSCLIAKKKNIISDSPYKVTTFLAFPFGVFLYFYIMHNRKNTLSKSLNK